MLLTAAVAIVVSVVTAGAGAGVGAAMIAGAAGGFAGGFVGTLLNGGNIGQAFTAGIIGGAIGAASGFLNFAAGSVSFTGIGATIERAAKHAFVDVWMGGVKNAVYGGELSPLRDAVGGALSSVGNGFINDKFDNTALKVAASAVLGGTVSEIGGGKFANGAVTGAYSMIFNELAHLYYSLKNKKNFQGVKGLTIEYYTAVADDSRAGGHLKFTFTDALIDENIRVYQLAETVYNGEYEKEWDGNSKDLTYPFAYYEGNNTVSFTDTSWSNKQNGDYFKGTIFINLPKGGYILKLNWGWKMVNNQPRMEYIRTHYYKNKK